MQKINEPEKTQLKLKLYQKIDKFIEEVGNEDNNIGWIPNEIVERMTDAAFAVLMAVHDTNNLMKEEKLLKDE